MKTFSQITFKNILIALILLVVVMAGALAIRDYTKKPVISTSSIRLPAKSAMTTLPVFVQKVYNARLSEWGDSDRTFVSNHKMWFSKNFLRYSIDTTSQGPFLFCSTPKKEPAKFKVTAGSLSTDQQSTTIYVTDTGSNPVVINLPVLLQVQNGYWTIEQLNCNAI
jgi:hypothetical protein